MPPQVPDSPPPIIGLSPPAPASRPAPLRQLLATLLSLCLGLFLADAIISLLDDSLILLADLHLLTLVRSMAWILCVLMVIVVYGLIGLTPLIPKRLFLPVTIFNPLAMLLTVPVAIYAYGRLQQFSWVISLCQVILGLGMLYCVQGGIKFRWPLVAQTRLSSRHFSWLNLTTFLLVNLLVVLPIVLAYLAVCACLAVDHFSAGFLALRPGGLTVQVRKYVRDDGKTVQLVPMAHIGEAGFYHMLAQSFPTNAMVLMEGVTDNSNLLTNEITYQRMATSLGLAEQEKEFNPIQVEMVMADIDVDQFHTNTIGLLNLTMLIHTRGLNTGTLLTLLRFSPPPHFEKQLVEDLLRKRNRHLLAELQARLPESDTLVVPWGAAHMPGIAEGLQASGFRLGETRDCTVIRFRLPGRSTARTAN
jgi:hypothetical protein